MAEGKMALPRVSEEALRSIKVEARLAVKGGDPGASVYWMHQHKAAGDLVVGCHVEPGAPEKTRHCSRRWSVFANTSALAVTNEWIGVPSGCVGISPPPLDAADLRGSPALSAKPPVPAVFMGVIRHPVERWQSELSYGWAPVYNIKPLASLFVPREALETAEHYGASKALSKLGITGSVSPRADATAEEIDAALVALRAFMRGSLQRPYANRCVLHENEHTRNLTPPGWTDRRGWPTIKMGWMPAVICYADNIMVRALASVCKCRMYDAVAHAKAVAPDMRILFNNGAPLGKRKANSSFGDATIGPAPQPDGERERLPSGLGPSVVSSRTGCKVDFGQDAPPRPDEVGSGIVPVTEEDYERAKEVARRFHALMPMERIFAEPASFADILREVGGLNVSHDWSMEGDQHATGRTLRILEVPGLREVLEEDNKWDMKLYRYLYDELWEDYKREAAAGAQW